jgi:phospholipase/carboxylesterase
MLHYESRIPEDVREGAPLVVLLHGRGSDEQDLLSLAPHLPAGAMVVAPRAPFPGAPWGYGPGWAWYRYIGEDRPEPESFAEAQRELADLVRALPALLPVRPGEVVVGGFSQGATMSLGLALRDPELLSRVLCFSGFLPSHLTVRATPESVAGTRFFWGHGTRDGNIPFAMAEQGRAARRAAGAALETRDYPIGHWIAPEELADAVEWMGRG